jgi:hypothetical protein
VARGSFLASLQTKQLPIQRHQLPTKFLSDTAYKNSAGALWLFKGFQPDYAQHQEQQEQRDGNVEQYFGHSGRARGNTGKSEHGGNQREMKKIRAHLSMASSPQQW